MDIEEAFKIFGKPNPVPPNLPGDTKNSVIIGIMLVLIIGSVAYMIHRKGKRKNDSDNLTN